MKKTKLLYMLLLFSLVSCLGETGSNFDSSKNDVSFDMSSTSSTYMSVDHTHSSKCDIYSKSNEDADYFEYKLNTKTNSYSITGFNKDADFSSVTELRIPLQFNNKVVDKIDELDNYSYKEPKFDKLIFPEEFGTIGKLDIYEIKEVVLPRKLVKLSSSCFSCKEHSLVDITWVEDCVDFTPPTGEYINITYPINCEEVKIPTYTLVFSFTLPLNAKSLSVDSNESYNQVKEVFNPSPYITDEMCFEVLDGLKVVHKVGEKSNISLIDGIYFYADDKEAIPLEFDYTVSQAIFPSSVNGQNYGIKEGTFVSQLPQNIVISKDITYCESGAFITNNGEHPNFFFETESIPETFGDYFFFNPGFGGNKYPEIEHICHIYYVSQWSYVNGIATPNS